MEFILLVAAVVISFLVFTWLIKVVRATIGTAILIALLVLVLQLVFGIGPAQVWQQITQLFQAIWQAVTGG